MVGAETIAIITALPVEARCLSSRKLAIGQTIFLTNNLMLHVAGMGSRRARSAALHVIGLGASAVVSWGTAGGLDPQVSVGSLVLPDQIIDQQQRVFPVDSSWRDQYHASLGAVASVSRGALLQVDEIITAVAGKRQLFARCQAVAIDMESAAIAAVAQEQGARFIAVRGIVDAADSVVPEWLSQSLSAAGEIRPWALMSRLCRRPLRVFELIQLARAFSAAKSTLQKAAKLIPCDLPPRAHLESIIPDYPATAQVNNDRLHAEATTRTI